MDYFLLQTGNVHNLFYFIFIFSHEQNLVSAKAFLERTRTLINKTFRFQQVHEIH